MKLFIGAILGFISVSFGAFAEHGLKKDITEEAFRQIMVAVRYNQIYSALIVALALFLIAIPKDKKIYKAVNLTSWIFIFGTVIFTFSIYLSKTTSLDFLVNLAPIGGMSLMLGWLILAFSAIKCKH
jgi:uncharacterized membrane protein YgdD (TMEM256/DUF423 family)